MLTIKTNPEMDAKIVGILRTAEQAACHYAAQRIEELEAEKKRLQDIVGKLPKTKDGVPVTPGMEVWEPDGKGGYQPFVASSVNMFPSSPGHNMYGDCYSTREAADAAGGTDG